MSYRQGCGTNPAQLSWHSTHGLPSYTSLAMAPYQKTKY